MTTEAHWPDEPAWLTDPIKLLWAEAVIELLARGGGILPNEIRFNSDIDPNLLQTVVFPDGEHNIMAWIKGGEHRRAFANERIILPPSEAADADQS